MSEYFPEQLDLSNYAIKADFKNATGVDTSKFAKTVWFNKPQI